MVIDRDDVLLEEYDHRLYPLYHKEEINYLDVGGYMVICELSNEEMIY